MSRSSPPSIAIITIGLIVMVPPKHPQDSAPSATRGKSTVMKVAKTPERASQPSRGTVITRATTASSAAIAKRKVSQASKGLFSITEDGRSAGWPSKSLYSAPAASQRMPRARAKPGSAGREGGGESWGSMVVR